MARQALAAARATGTIALSEAVFGEVAAVIARPKFMPVLTADRLSEVLELLAAAALWVEPATKVEDCHHAKDNCYLELALAAGALVIVSGDEDLLVLHPWRGARVLRPSHFVAEIEANP
jgi:putative PIN family toxin of toxin-antitoxin system